MIDDTQILAIANAFRTWEHAEDCYIRQFRVTFCGVYTEAYTPKGAIIDRVLTHFADDILEVIKNAFGSQELSEITILHYKNPERYSIWLKGHIYGNVYRQFLTEGLA